MIIRNGRPEDGPVVVPLLLSAIEDIAYMLTGASTKKEAAAALLRFYENGGNRVGYENTIVAEVDGQPAGFALFYHGRDAERLDRPLEARVERLSGRQEVRFPREAAPDEFYLDSLAVDAAYRGRGIAQALLAAFEAEAVARGHNRVALIVEAGNDRARRLYEKIGYVRDDELELCGHRYDHMAKRPSPAVSD